MDPGIIEIRTAGYCKDCPFMDLSVQTFHAYTMEPIAADVECKYRAICDRIYHNTVMSLTEGVEGNDSQKVH